MKLGIIIPAYNEEQRIGRTLERYTSFYNQLTKQKRLKYTLLIVINGTRDKTELIVKRYTKKNKNVCYINLLRGGKGYAITEGFRYLLKEKSCSHLGFVDADLATSPQEFYKLYGSMGSYDGVIASRWLKSSVIKTPQPLLRRITSRTFNFLTRSILLLNFTDTQCGAKVFSRQAIKSVINSIGNTRWAYDIDLLYKLQIKGCRIKEVPTVWEDQKGSRLNLLKVPLEMFLGLLRIRLINSPLKDIVRAYDALPESLKISHRL